MSTALGLYIKALREAQGWERPDVLARLGERESKPVDPSWLWRIEEKGHWPKHPRITTLLEILGARQADVWLQEHPSAADEARERADDAYRQAAARMTDADLNETIALLERLKSDRKALGRWLEYGERLLAGRAPDTKP